MISVRIPQTHAPLQALSERCLAVRARALSAFESHSPFVGEKGVHLTSELAQIVASLTDEVEILRGRLAELEAGR